jgi:hypothetical protein
VTGSFAAAMPVEQSTAVRNTAGKRIAGSRFGSRVAYRIKVRLTTRAQACAQSQ